MERETFIITINDEEVSDLYEHLVSLEIEVDEELAAMFRLRIGIALKPDGSWTFLDDERFRVWHPVTIEAGLESGPEEIISGYITHINPAFATEMTQCTLEIWGMDNSVLMDREEKLKEWPNKKDSDIAAEIFGQYSLTPEVEATETIHDEAISTTLQRETDIQFLRRLALRNGFECFVKGSKGYFQSPQIDAPAQPVLAVHFGDETNVQQLSLAVNALTSANVSMFQLDRATKEVLNVTTESSQQAALGAMDAAGMLAPGMNPGEIFVRGVVAGQPEMAALCQGLYDQGNWFVTGAGKVAANDYGHVLKPRQPVTIKGIGETYSGIYYVTHVTHVFTPEGYTQSFRVKRNGLLPTGSETFAASTGRFGGLL